MVSTISLAATIVGPYLTAPVEDSVIENFYRKTRPFGLWKPFKKMLDPDVRESMLKEHRNDLVSVPFALGWQIHALHVPDAARVRNYTEFFYTFSLFLLSLAGMYFLWYRNLPPKEGGHSTTNLINDPGELFPLSRNMDFLPVCYEDLV